jgi:four helix bundle protein
MSFKFEKLQVWQKALDLSTDIHHLTRKFPKEELYILTSQIKRAADSVALNIAEGSTGQTNAGFKQFLGYAVRSALEVIACLHLSLRRNLIDDVDFQKLYTQTEEIIRMLSGLKNALN